jgi:hypothetical protein
MIVIDAMVIVLALDFDLHRWVVVRLSAR